MNKNHYKPEDRKMFTEADIKKTISIITKSGAEKIYVVGNVGSGKTTFARELSLAIDYKNMDIDQWFRILHQEQQRKAVELKELLAYILQKEKPPFIINHAELLKQDLIQDADIIIFLNPKKEELLKNRQIRTENDVDGDWQAIKIDDYDKITEQNLAKLKKINGKIKYTNEKSGTTIYVLNNN